MGTEANQTDKVVRSMSGRVVSDKMDKTVTVLVERQVMQGLPEVRAALFVIRLYLTESAEVRGDAERRRALRTALAGMSPESRAYKGIASSVSRLIEWLSDE